MSSFAGGLVKSCCATAYSGPWARYLLGESFHPGGLPLTRRLGRLAGLDAGSRVLDVAAGRGSSALELATTFGSQVVGFDLSPRQSREATQRAGRLGLGARTRFLVADAERVGLGSGVFDAVICECALCTFPDQAAAAAEFARLLRPGGRLGLSDVVRDGPLPAELEGVLGTVACITEALPVAGYRHLLEGPGLRVEHVERHDGALLELLSQMRTRLLAAELLRTLGQLDLPALDLPQAHRLLRLVEQAIAAGLLGYALLVAVKPAATSRPQGSSASP